MESVLVVILDPLFANLSNLFEAREEAEPKMKEA